MELSQEQKDRLKKLDAEMLKKKQYEDENRSRKEATSKRTGIPYTLVDMDVIKLGVMFGLIKNKEAVGTKTGGGLLSLLMGDEQAEEGVCDLRTVPYYFRHASTTVTESERIAYHKEFVGKKCVEFSKSVEDLVDAALGVVGEHLTVILPNKTLDALVEVFLENITILMESLEEEDDDEVMMCISLVRNCLLGPLSICEYKKLVVDHITRFRRMGKSGDVILKSLSLNDCRLTMYPGYQVRDTSDINNNPFYDEILIRHFTKDPKLNMFNFDTILSHCCIPSLITIPVEEILAMGLIGPYRNNPIGFLSTINQNPSDPWAFYILKTITSSGCRLWVVDYRLSNTATKLGFELSDYISTMFRTVYKSCFGHNNFKAAFYNSHHGDIFRRLISNLEMVNNIHRLRAFIARTLIGQSTIIPTQFDLFNTQELRPQPPPPKFNLHPNVMLRNLFDSVTSSDIGTIRSDLQVDH